MSKPRKRARRTPERWPSPTWRVTISAHDIPPRWDVPARTLELGASTAESACRTVARWAHIDAGIPPLRSMLAVSMEHASAERAENPATRSEMAA